MLAPHIKKKVDELWNRFWAAGLTNPLVAVEQITYLLFLKRLEDIDNTRVNQGWPSLYAGHEQCKWSYIRQEKSDPKHLIETVFPWLRELDKHIAQQNLNGSELAGLNNRMADAYFQLDPNKGQVLGDAIDKIDQLFARAGDGSAAQDIMGDTFEYLLSEVASAGKNGQFRTPRHLIRFMVELLDPEPGQRIIDPAAGTGGFLFSAQQYLMRKFSAPDNVVLEWDGAPHRTDGSAATPEQYAAIHNGANFVGLDNDRTMVRIGWMNLILHNLNDPQLVQGDSLSKREGKPQLAKLLESETYDAVLANPPFTGTVDSADMEKDSVLFPSVGGKGKKKDDAITNKSELLFLWLMLDLLKVGGRCVVIVPEGVLFGNTDAHVRLRRELLNEHAVEGVISLPGGVFQPYTGVKTSILVFRKETRREEKKAFSDARKPRTDYVWFYEVEDDGYSLDAKRNARPGRRNDLWDALEKFRLWQNDGSDGARQHEKTYLHPRFHEERWRQALLRDAADRLTPAGEAFSGSPDASMWDGKVWGIHELFPKLPANPADAERHVQERSAALLEQAFIVLYKQAGTDALLELTQHRPMEIDRKALAIKYLNKALTELRRKINECKKYFEDPEEARGWRLFQFACEEARKRAYDQYVYALDREQGPSTPGARGHDLHELARDFAMLDGFDVTLRSREVDQRSELKTAKHWTVPVRAFARNDEWRSDDGALVGSHDADGREREAYAQAMLAAGLYDEDGALKDGLLDPDCIEARDWILSAGQYKPFDFAQLKSDKSVAQLIAELKATEQQVIAGLDKLLEMVEGRE